MAAAIIICLLVGGLCGMINGFLIVKYQLSAVIVTLSTMILYRGLAYVILEDQSAGDFPSWFSYFGWGYVGKIPFILILYLLFTIIYNFTLLFKTFCINTYLLGCIQY